MADAAKHPGTARPLVDARDTRKWGPLGDRRMPTLMEDTSPALRCQGQATAVLRAAAFRRLPADLVHWRN